MCFSVNNILEGFLQGFNCYSEELKNQITKNILQDLVQQGYIQASIRVNKIWQLVYATCVFLSNTISKASNIARFAFSKSILECAAETNPTS